jgi:hypothetical protein
MGGRVMDKLREKELLKKTDPSALVALYQSALTLRIINRGTQEEVFYREKEEAYRAEILRRLKKDEN